jgi:hypothetical protein
MSFPEWLGIVASVITIISISFNIYQWRASENIRRTFYSNILSEWNLMYQIRELADQCCSFYQDINKTESERLDLIIRNVKQTTGIADSSRTQLKTFSENYFKRPIQHQHPAQVTQTS